MTEEKNNKEHRLAAAVGYIGVLFLIPLYFYKDSPFAQFHGKQGMVLFIAWAINSFLMIIPVLGWIVSFIGSILLFVVTVVAVIRTYTGEKWVIPYIGKYSERIKL